MQNIEEMLKVYYKKQKRIEYLKGRYTVLGDNIREIMQCISETRHTLEIILPAQRYDLERVSTSKTRTSPQEEALLDSERRMELKIRELQRDQQDSLIERYELEGECEQIDKLILSLEDDERIICEMKYRHRKSLRYIGNEICADHSTVRRRLDNIHDKITEELGLTA